MKAFIVSSLLISSQAVKFYDDFDDDMNGMVQEASQSTTLYSKDPTLSIALQRPDPQTKIGKFSFSQALDYSEGKNLNELDQTMSKEYDRQFSQVDKHNSQVEQKKEQEIAYKQWQQQKPRQEEGPGFKYAQKLTQAAINGDDLPPNSDDFVALTLKTKSQSKSRSRAREDDPTIADPGAEAGDDLEDDWNTVPLVGRTGKEVNITDPVMSGSYGSGPEIDNAWSNGRAPEGSRLAAKNVTGYIVADPKVLPEDERTPGTFGDMDDVLNNHWTGDSRERAKQAQDPDLEPLESKRLPYSTWKEANNASDAPPSEQKPDELMDYLTKL